MSSIVAWVVDVGECGIVADHRETPSGVPDALTALGVPVRTATLRVGDYAIGVHTRVERKTVRDLHESVVSGRFWTQLNHLRAITSFPVILVEGRDVDAGPLSRNGIRGVLVALSDRGIPVLRATDPADSARWIRALLTSREQRRRVQVHAPFRRPVGRRDPTAVAMLSVVPTISLANARDLVDTFGKLRTIANADVGDLTTVSGIGPRRAGAVYEAFNQLF